jgi:predicted TIM-barrel fold metal-dependent hydrolase
MPDFSHVPYVDNHAHWLYAAQDVDSMDWFTRHFTEATDAEMRGVHVKNTLFFERLISQLAKFFGCEPSFDSVMKQRSIRGSEELTKRLMEAAHFGGIVIDEGYPPPPHMEADAISEVAACEVATVLRVETMAGRALLKAGSYDDWVTLTDESLSSARATGFSGFKSIIAYRSGLPVEDWRLSEVKAAFSRQQSRAKDDVMRLTEKPLLDSLLMRALGHAAKQELVVQFHTGYGDRDVDLLLANPLQLRPILENPAFEPASFVLLHEAFPYTREAGYLAATYSNVYLDLSFGIPFLSHDEMVQMVREGLGLAPWTRIVSSSDTVGIPELYWYSAVEARLVLQEVLGTAVARNDVTMTTAERIASAILANNAARLYQFDVRV